MKEVDALEQKKKDSQEKLDHLTKMLELKEKELNMPAKKKEFEKLQNQIMELHKKTDQSKVALYEQEKALDAKRSEFETKEKAMIAREKSLKDIKASFRVLDG